MMMIKMMMVMSDSENNENKNTYDGFEEKRATYSIQFVQNSLRIEISLSQIRMII